MGDFLMAAYIVVAVQWAGVFWHALSSRRLRMKIAASLLILSTFVPSSTSSPAHARESVEVDNSDPWKVQDEVPLVPPTPAAHIVQSGESMWSIAEQHVHDEEVVAKWLDIIEWNKERIASGNVNLIFPGEVLVVSQL